jgi:heme exporter protein C
MRRLLLLLAFVLLLLSMWMALTLGQITPVKRNILYVHVPSSICALLCFVVLLVASIGYLATEKPIWDLVGAASAEVGIVFATILNLTGMIFSRAEWNIWWTPSPRLITSAILWFLYIVYLILRANLPDSQQRRARVCAVFGIIAFLDVPMVVISARFMPDIHRPNFSFESSWQSSVLMLSMAATALLAAVLIWLKTDILKNKARLEKESVC